MKQTAVEWFLEEIINNNFQKASEQIEVFERAKELEKEQLHKAWKASEKNMRSQFSSSNYKNLTFDEYYETKT